MAIYNTFNESITQYSTRLLAEIAYNDIITCNQINYYIAESQVLNEGIISTIWDALIKFIRNIKEKILAFFSKIIKSSGNIKERDKKAQKKSKDAMNNFNNGNKKNAKEKIKIKYWGIANLELHKDFIDGIYNDMDYLENILIKNIDNYIDRDISADDYNRFEQSLDNSLNVLKSVTISEITRIVYNDSTCKSDFDTIKDKVISDKDTLSKLQNLKSMYREEEITLEKSFQDFNIICKWMGADQNKLNKEKNDYDKLFKNMEKTIEKTKKTIMGKISYVDQETKKAYLEKICNKICKISQEAMHIESSFVVAFYSGVIGLCEAIINEKERIAEWQEKMSK